jgi:hypothetical protein
MSDPVEPLPRVSLRGVARLLRGEVGPLLGIGLFLVPLGIGLMPCGIGFPLAWFAFGLMTRTLLRAASRTHGRAAPPNESRRWAGAMALAGLLLLVLGMGLGGGVTAEVMAGSEPHERLFGAGVTALLLAVALGAALGPCGFAPFLVLEGVAPAASLARSFELAARIGPRRFAWVGVASALAVALPLLAVCAVLVNLRSPPEAFASFFVALPVGLALGPSLAGAILAEAYVEATALGPVDVLSAPAKLRALRLLVLPALGLMVLTLGVALVTPLPMRELPDEPSRARGFSGAGYTITPPVVPIPGGLAAVHALPGGVSIDAYDGGGAGRVSARFGGASGSVAVVDGARYGGDPGTFAVLLSSGTRRAVTIVDADGVRQDDGIGPRVLGRLGLYGGSALALGLALVLVLFARLGLALGEAYALGAPEVREAPRRDGLAALEGVLRLAPGSSLRVRRDRCEVSGDAWVEADGGALRVRLEPRVIPWLGAPAAESALVEGAPLTLVSRSLAGSAVGLRDAAGRWPADGRLALGCRVDATRALVARASKLASWTAVPALVALVIAIASVLLAL